MKLKTSNFLLRSIAALLVLWLVVCGLGAGVGEGFRGTPVAERAGCCARKIKIAPCCEAAPGQVADCCAVEKSNAPHSLPALPVPPSVQPLPEWVPMVVAFLELPDLALTRVTPVASWVDEGFVVPVPLFLRDRVFLI